jgi:M6 family metalloprotease-like protein
MMRFVVVCCWVFFPLFLILEQSHASTVPAADTLRILAIRVEFQTDNSQTTTGDGRFNLDQSTDPFQIDPPPHNRSYFQDHLEFARNYFLKISRGDLVIIGDVFPPDESSAYQLDQPMGYYNPNTTPEKINEGLAKLLRDAIQKADAEDPAINFGDYQGYIVFHAGVGKDVDLGFDETPQDIPSLFITQEFLQESLGINGIPVDGGASAVSSGIILPETESQDGIELGLNGIVVSNIGSQLGWLDLFSPETRRSGVGRFSVMDAGLFNGDGLLPALPDAWTRIDAGLETPVTIYQAQDDEFTARQVLSNNEPRVYKLPINDREYFLLENRYAGKPNLDSLQFELGDASGNFPNMKEILQTYLSGAAVFSSGGVLIDIDNSDRGLPGSGILIWHVDENVIEQNRAANQINADPNYRGVDLEEADGSQDIGQVFDFLSGGSGSEIGTALDLWYRENSAPLYQQSPANEFSVRSVPNSRSYYNRANSHIKIFNFSSRDSVMTFQVSFNFFQPNFPVSLNVSKYGKVISLKTTDLDQDGRGDLIITTDQNKVLAMNYMGTGAWSDSLEVGSTPTEIVPSPAVYQLPDGTKGIVTLSKGGMILLREFDLSARPLIRLIISGVADSVTTFPSVEYDWLTGNKFPEQITLDSSPKIYWGSKDGSVYQLEYDSTSGWQLSPETFFPSIGEPVAKLHFTDPSRAIIVGESGKVYINNTEVTAVDPKVFQPAGYDGISVNEDGFFFELLNHKYDHPEDGIHHFDAALVAIARKLDAFSTLYLIPGQNHLKVFNYNFTLVQNFPVKIFDPDQPVTLSIPALAGPFPTQSQDTDLGVVVADPSGGISGFDMKGNALPDFPLAVGDRITVSPAILDIDGDGDTELACVTENGSVYVWDFSSDLAGDSYQYWLQANANEMNQNRHAPNRTGNPPGAGGGSTAQLLPESKVYNWPNPNLDNYTFIRYHLTQSATVRIKIYDLAGDLVKELNGPGHPSTDNEVRWDLTDVQSGVYLARVEASGQGKTETRFIKIAVVK